MPRGTEGDEGEEKQTLCCNVFFMLRLHCSMGLHMLLGFSCFIAHLFMRAKLFLNFAQLSTCVCVRALREWREGHTGCSLFVCVCVI